MSHALPAGMTKKTTKPFRMVTAANLALVTGGGGMMSLLNTSAVVIEPPAPQFRTIALAD